MCVCVCVVCVCVLGGGGRSGGRVERGKGALYEKKKRGPAFAHLSVIVSNHHQLLQQFNITLSSSLHRTLYALIDYHPRKFLPTYFKIWLIVLEEKLICNLFVYVKLLNSRVGHFRPQGPNLNNLGRGLLDKAINLNSVASGLIVSDKKIFVKIFTSLYIKSM